MREVLVPQPLYYFYACGAAFNQVFVAKKHVHGTIVLAGVEAFLDSEWPERIASCIAVEAAADISLKKNQLAYRTATADADGAVPRC